MKRDNDRMMAVRIILLLLLLKAGTVYGYEQWR